MVMKVIEIMMWITMGCIVIGAILDQIQYYKSLKRTRQYYRELYDRDAYSPDEES